MRHCTLYRKVRACLQGWLISSVLLSTAHASPLDLRPYQGKVVYLDFWASWCTPCRRSFPWLDSVAQQYKQRDLVVIGVNVDHDRGLAEKFLKDTPVLFPIVYDPQGEVASEFQVMGMPSAVLIDRSGKVRFQHIGFSDKRKEEYEAHVQTLLDEPAR
jgi:thiol-disulfide isomerase/thioredoxin